MGRSRTGPVRTALLGALVTTTAVTLPLWVAFTVLSDVVDLSGTSIWLSVLLGVSLLVALLAGPAAAWGWGMARLAGAPARPVIRVALRTGLGLAILVGIGVDLSQLLIDTVWRSHRLAVHGLFAAAFAIGMAVFLGRVAARTAGVLPDGPPTGTTGRVVAAATALGVLLGALVAIPLDWVVVVGMGPRMLLPLYLVLVTGSAAGGAALGALVGRASTRPAVPATAAAEVTA